MTRRSIFARILSFCTVSPLLAGSRLSSALHHSSLNAAIKPIESAVGGKLPFPDAPEGIEIIRSFDALVWAAGFVKHVQANPAIATDEETMVAWFASALMRGYDERESHLREEVAAAGGNHVALLTCESVRGAAARGWCADLNSRKVFDGDLALAISQEVLLLNPDRVFEPLEAWCDRCVKSNLELAAENERLRGYRDAVEGALA